MPDVGRVARRTFRSLENRNYRLLFIGLAVSMTGFWMQTLGELWLVQELSDRALALGIAGALHFAPMLLGGVYGGVIADRADKRRLLLATQSAQAALALVLFTVTQTDVVELWMVYLIAFLSGCVTAVDNPTRRSFVYELVGRDDISNAAGLNSMLMSATRVIGPAIGAVVIAAAGVAACFLANAVSYLAVLFALAAMDATAIVRTPTTERSSGQLREGLRYAWSNPDVRVPLLMMAVIGTLAFNYQVVFPRLATEVYDGGAGTLGALLSLASVGSLVGAGFMASRETITRGFLVGAALVMGAAVLAASASPAIGPALVSLVVVGGAGGAFISASAAAVQVSAAPAMQGRVLALHAVLFLGSTPVGGPVIGALSDAFGPRVGFGVGGAAALATAAVAGRGLIRARSRRAVPVPDARLGLVPEE